MKVDEMFLNKKRIQIDKMSGWYLEYKDGGTVHLLCHAAVVFVDREHRSLVVFVDHVDRHCCVIFQLPI